MKTILLYGGQLAVVDDQDYELLSCFSWYADKAVSGGALYAKTNVTAAARVRMEAKGIDPSTVVIQRMMHRLIMQPPSGIQIDHINHDTLDNRRSNLRFVTAHQNILNRKKMPTQRGKVPTSQYKGVSRSSVLRQQSKPWRSEVQVTLDGKKRKRFLGWFVTEEEAAIAYNLAAKELHGSYAHLNTIPQNA